MSQVGRRLRTERVITGGSLPWSWELSQPGRLKLTETQNDMKKTTFALLALGLSALFAGCGTTRAPVTRVNYPVTYQVQVGNSQARSDAGPQNLSVTATQEVATNPSEALYYRVVSPFDVSVVVYEKDGSSGTRRQIGQLQGMNFGSSVVSSTDRIEFTFASASPNTGGGLQFTISDRPIAQ